MANLKAVIGGRGSSDSNLTNGADSHTNIVSTSVSDASGSGVDSGANGSG